MSILRNKIRERFVQVPNALVTDTRLSIPARLIYVYLASKPDGWIVRNGDVMKSLGIRNSGTMAKYWHELEESGWIIRQKTAAGTYDYELSEIEPIAEKPNEGNSVIAENPYMGKSETAYYNNTDSDSNKENNNKIDYNNTPPIYTPPQNEPEPETEDDELPFDENDIPPFLTPEDIAEMKQEAKKQKQQKRQEQPVFTDTISELKHRLNTLYCRRETTAWSKKEIISLKEISKRNGVLDEMTEIENLYNSGYQYARRDIKTLLNNWTTELDRARLKNKPRRLAWS